MEPSTSTSAAMPMRPSTSVLPPIDGTPSFSLKGANKSYKHQYANIYFVRLRLLRDAVQRRAQAQWKDVKGSPVLAPRVLDVLKSQLCYIVGTVYMDMPLKPNVLEDIGRDRSIPAPPPRDKIYSADDSISLEDESGRIRLIGEPVEKAELVTGVIIAALGIETPSGEFQVVDICPAGLAPQPDAEPSQDDEMEVDDTAAGSSDEWIGVVSGLNIGSISPADAEMQMLAEYLVGEVGGPDEFGSSSKISRLIIAGDSLSSVVTTTVVNSEIDGEKKSKRYGYDSTSFSPHPTLNLSSLLLDIGSSMPIHVLPGESDPAGTILPQQPFPRAMLGAVSSYSSISCETNPTYLRIASGMDAETSASTSSSSRKSYTRTLLVNSGQPLNDMFKYLPSSSATRLSIAESTLRWRHIAPTAPDTLWCHPYFTTDPFVISQTPDLYIVGCQPKFQTKLVSEKDKRCRIVLVPRFSETGILVLVNLRTLDVKTVQFATEGMASGGNEDDSYNG
ncbi:hypothetical protein NEOLEDRAFT_1161072 [Neolentinus lepideus HHB14362 ss-1]|uniref:DNA-directed DNA polymerase n=1 Tax=Neolentinus lepideus HHB14362 ss-1 TaxID=1314782 RepID=A0A165URI0_9AGAM|nr:hypothetical protein NEOLEDRAFT_1161072 [Neolentinus lepideus HHB14362 ss-1]